MSKKALLLYVLFLTCCVANAQQAGTRISLREALQSIESRYHIKFNYIEHDIANATVSAIPQGSTQEIIAKLALETGLFFNRVSDHYIVIKPAKVKSSQLCGLLLDADTKEPIPFATIALGPKQSTQSDAEGRFCFFSSNDKNLHISHVGYKDKMVALSNFSKEGTTTIELSVHIAQLSEVQIMHLLTRGIRKGGDGSYKIESKNTGILPGMTEPDVFQTIQQLPGAVSLDETVSNISFRGGTHDQNLFLWNGIRLYQTGHFFGLISALNPNLSQSFTVYKNASPAQYGQAVSGTVIIETLPESGDFYESSLGVNMLNVDFNTSFKTSEKADWQFSARRSITDYFASPTYKSYFKRIFQNTKITNLFIDEDVNYKSSEDFYFYDITGQYRQKIGKRSELRINSILISNALNVNQSIADNNGPINEKSKLDQQTIAGNACFSTKWESGDATELTLHYTNYSIDSRDMFIESNRILKQENRILDKGLGIHHSIAGSKNFSLQLGYQLNHTNIDNTNNDNTFKLQNSKEHLLSHAVYAQADTNYKQFFLTAGIRQNYFQTLRTFRTEPRFLIRYNLTEDFALELQGEMKSQTTQQIVDFQENFFGLEKRRWTLSNGDNLPVTKSSQLSFAANFQKRKWLFTAEPFIKKVSGINSISKGFQGQFEFANTLGKYTVYGIETLVQKQWRNFTGWVTYQYNNNEYEFDRLHDQDFTSNQEVPHAVRSGFIFDNKRWQFALGGSWMSGRFYTQPASRVPEFDENQNPMIVYRNPNSSQLNDYLQLNASISFTSKLSDKMKCKAGISVQNLLDSSETINRSYRINSQNSTIEEVNINALENTFNAFVRVYFL
ncbi:TonB-dependent receptor [Flavobacterium chungangense]|uniref:TonB-dependent receptor n=1 Tax=Flavobacterium chungangense TaxID=554283 RepID=A0A6V6YQW8_9FLAO|nr:carboxypeptidase-like regulatory domain-containing protein [Flavobacterium chungangense]CAD0001714.1 TonB-dependent receptor [Flavobacterium chungangense]